MMQLFFCYALSFSCDALILFSFDSNLVPSVTILAQVLELYVYMFCPENCVRVALTHFQSRVNHVSSQ